MKEKVALFDASKLVEVEKHHKHVKKKLLINSAISFIFVSVMITVLLHFRSISIQSTQQALAYSLSPILLFLFTIYFVGSLFEYTSIDFLRIYNDSLNLPYTTLSSTLLKHSKAKFIPFSQIEEIYSKHGEETPLGANSYPPYIYIKKKRGIFRTEAFHINEIGGEEQLDEFVNIIKDKVEKVNIIWSSKKIYKYRNGVKVE